MTTLPISCYIRTQDEERMIGHVLEAASKVCNELIIVDSGSTDKTIEIAKSYGAKIIHQPWLGNGCQKRVGEKACTNDWVLDLDADEILDTTSIHSIKSAFESMPNATEVFSLTLVTVPPYGEVWHKTNLDPRNKLYNKTIYQQPDHKAWDQLELPSDARVTPLSGGLLHYSFKGVEHMMNKSNKGSTSRAVNGKLKPKTLVIARIFVAFPFYFFRHYCQKGLWRQGVYGFIVAILGAFARWLRDAKMLEVHYRNEGKGTYDDQGKVRDLNAQ